MTLADEWKLYVSRLLFRYKQQAEWPDSWYQCIGVPFIDTPHGRILRPSLSRFRRHRTGV